jgi:lipoprotein LprG
MSALRPRLLVAALVPVLLALGGCSSADAPQPQSPEESLAAAKATLDETPGVHILLETKKLPTGVNGILRADGYGTHAPAFRGTIKVAASGVTVDVPVVSVDDTVYAKLPFTTDFAEIDPGEYGAPDPAVLMGSTAGFSSLLTSVEDLKQGAAQRAGADVLNTYTGTPPGSVVAGIIPTAAAAGVFDATFTVSEDDVLNKAVLTGPFYPQGGDVTYTVTFDEYDTAKEITKP